MQTKRNSGPLPADFIECDPIGEVLDTSFMLREGRLRPVDDWGPDDDWADYESPQLPNPEGFQILDPAHDGGGMSYEEREAVGCGQTIRIPDGMVTYVDGQLWRMAVEREAAGTAPLSPAELIIRGTRNGVIARGWEKAIGPEVIMTAAKLAAASAAGISIRTPLRGIARHLSVNYQRFLAVRQMALRVIVESDLNLVYTDED